MTYGMRYIIPMLPFYLMVSAFGLKVAYDRWRKKRPRMAQLIGISVVSLVCIQGIYPFNRWHKLSNTVREAGMYEVAQWLNKYTPKDALIAAAEVHVAYYAERRCLSLDGIIDGKAIPYIKAGSNMIDFLQKYTFQYILGQYIEKFGRGTIFMKLVPSDDNPISIGHRIQIDRAKFVVMEIVNDIPIYRICYE